MRAWVYVLLAVLAPALAACHRPSDRGEAAHADTAWLTDGAAATGLTFAHANGMTGGHFMTEIIGSGVALFDYDNDGDLDVFLVQSRGQGRLFRNDLSNGTLHFTDVTAASGIVTSG